MSVLPRVSRYSLLVTESIETQDTKFGNQLERYIQDIKSEIENKTIKKPIEVQDHPSIKIMEGLIKDRLGLTVKFITNEYLAAVIPFYSNQNHIFLPEFLRGSWVLRDQLKVLDGMKEPKGTVNLREATVSGVFSKFETPLYMNYHALFTGYDMTTAEATGILLHELGHAFNACYFSDRSDRTNQVLASVARYIVTKEKPDLEYVYKELKKVSPNTKKEDVDTMLNGPKVIASVRWFRQYVEIVKSQLEYDTYNDTSFEQLADNFASRFGYGKQLLTSLDKLSSFTVEKNKALAFFDKTLSILGTAAVIAIIVGSFGLGNVFVALAWVAIGFCNLIGNREDVMDHTYDALKQRYLRVRNDTVEQLKDLKMDPARAKQYIDEIYVMDAIIKETAVHKTFVMKLANLVFSKSRNTAKDIEDQQLLEALSANDLFLRAAEFRTLNA